MIAGRPGTRQQTRLIGIVLVLILLVCARPLAVTLLLNLGYLELARRTPASERARDFFQQAAVIEPQMPRVARALGVLGLTEGDGAGAYSFLQRAAAVWDDRFAHWQMARALDAMGKPEEANAEYRLAEASSLFVNAALRQRHQKDWSGAEQNFLRALEIAPQDAGLARAVGEFYRESGKTDRAVIYLERALEFERDAYARALLRGELADLRHDIPSADLAFHDAIRQKPGVPDGYRLLAESYLARGDPAGAIRVLEKGTVLAAPTFGLNLRLAQLLIAEREWSAAERALARAQTEQENSDEVYLVRAQLELARHKPAAAVPALAKALTLAPHNAETHFWLGRALALTGQCAAARHAYADAIALAPDDARFAPAQQDWGACK